MPIHNKPGRPPGSSRLNAGDDLLLRRVADRMILAPDMKLTPAMVAEDITDETVHRRLRRKWKPVAARYLQDARTRREEAAAEAHREAMRRLADGAQRFAVAVQATGWNVTAAINKWVADNPDVIAGWQTAAQRLQALNDQVARSFRR